MLAWLAVLTGCGGERDVFDTPVDWWHDLQGGTISEQRPPPPGVGDPYPDLGQVPARPTPTDAAKRKAIFAALAAERDRATRQAARDPLVAPPPAPATPAAPAAPADAPPSMAVLEAANAPPPPKRKPDAPAVNRRPEIAPGPLPALEAAPVVSGPIPPIPDRPPSAPALEGEALPPGPPGVVNVYFRPGSALVPLDADAALRQLAAERGKRSIDVTAPGERDPGGLALGLRRAQAIAAVLTEAGVPASSMLVLAEGSGRAGIARFAGRN